MGVWVHHLLHTILQYCASNLRYRITRKRNSLRQRDIIEINVRNLIP